MTVKKYTGSNNIRYLFLGYLISALDRNKVRFLKNQQEIIYHETSIDLISEDQNSYPFSIIDFDLLLPVQDQIENYRLFELLQELKPLDLKILLLKSIHEYSFRDISQILDLDIQTIKSKYYFILKQFRKKLRRVHK